MADISVQRQALGRVSHLGHLYDERTDSFLGFSLFNCEISPNAIEKKDIALTDVSYLICGTTGEKLHALSIEPQLKLSLLSGLVALDGSSKYLSTLNDSSKRSSADLFYKTTSVSEEIDIAKLSADQINENCLKRNATHVVVGIKWGANVVGSFEYEWSDDETKKEIEGLLCYFLFV